MNQQQQATQPAQLDPPLAEDLDQEAVPHIDKMERTAAYVAQLASRLKYAQEFATHLKAASLIPEHLRTRKLNGKVVDLTPDEVEANLIMVVNQALTWEIEPFAAMAESYVLHGRLSYQAKLIAAVVNDRLAERLTPVWKGDQDEPETLSCVVTGRLHGETRTRSHETRWIDARTFENDGKTVKENWRKKPKQQLYYAAARDWARTHFQEVLFGIETTEEDDQVEALPDSSTPSGEALQRYFDLMDQAEHQGQVSKALLDGLFLPGLTKAEQRQLRDHAKKAAKGLPTVSAWLGIDDQAEPETIQDDPNLVDRYYVALQESYDPKVWDQILADVQADDRVKPDDQAFMEKWVHDQKTAGGQA